MNQVHLYPGTGTRVGPWGAGSTCGKGLFPADHHALWYGNRVCTYHDADLKPAQSLNSPWRVCYQYYG
eukprot:3595361-Rhodomonas_salina.2